MAILTQTRLFSNLLLLKVRYYPT